MTTAESIVAVDVGNSAIKVAISHFSGILDATIPGQQGVRREGDHGAEGELLQRSFPLDGPRWSDEICRWVARHAKSTSMSWWVSTVNHAASGPLHHAVTEAFGPANQLSRWQMLGHQEVPLQTDVDFPERLGIDRLIGAFAATIRFPTPLVVVDAGSAVTVDWIRRDPIGGPRFAGGAILPGIGLQHAVLASGTEGLSRPTEQAGQVAAFGGALEPARNTEQAIRLGVFAGVAGGIDRLAEEYYLGDRASTGDENHKSTENPIVVLTGGDGPRISAYLRTKHALVPNLVCLGLMDLATRECQKAPSGLK